MSDTSQQSVSLIGIPGSQLDIYWKQIRPFIQKSLKYADGKYNLADVYNGIKSRDMQLWSTEKLEGAMVTQIVIYPRTKRLSVMFIGGKGRDKWMHNWPHIEKWAKEQGCEAIEFSGRSGWEKVMRDFEKLHVVMRKFL